VLADGGLSTFLGFTTHTHAFDVHGTENCMPRLTDSVWNCGAGGEYYEISHNTFLYTEDEAVKVRGLPAIRVDVLSNVFRHQFESDALASTMGGLYSTDNRFGMNVSISTNESCDFDRDGYVDRFWATGETWWFSSGGPGKSEPWTYLATSKRTLDEVRLGDFDGDGRCDVLADGIVYSGGKLRTGP
jgi:FG-GAP-like repeat